jgi:hypothetical protein
MSEASPPNPLARAGGDQATNLAALIENVMFLLFVDASLLSTLPSK